MTEIEKQAPETLGEFLRLMHSLVLKHQMGIPNISVSDTRFDKYQPEKGDTEHSELSHKCHEVLYIALHKLAIGDEASFERVAEKFRQAREDGILAENPKLIITPENPPAYFRR